MARARLRKAGISTVPYSAGINQVHSALTNNRRGVDASVRHQTVRAISSMTTQLLPS